MSIVSEADTKSRIILPGQDAIASSNKVVGTAMPMRFERIRPFILMPTHCDLSVSSFEWAVNIYVKLWKVLPQGLLCCPFNKEVAAQIRLISKFGRVMSCCYEIPFLPPRSWQVYGIWGAIISPGG